MEEVTLKPSPANGRSAPRTRFIGASGTAASVIAAEAEEVGHFASDSFALPLLQGGTILWTLGYLIWVQPEVAALATLVYLPQALLVPPLQGAINRLSRRRTVLQRTIGKNVVDMGKSEYRLHHSYHQHARVLANQIFPTRIRIYKMKYFLNFLFRPILVFVGGGGTIPDGKPGCAVAAGVDELGLLQTNCSRQVGPTQIRYTQTSVVKIGINEPRPAEIGSCQRRTPQNGAAKIGIDKQRSPELRLFQIATG
jgi:hypothetical protein